MTTKAEIKKSISVYEESLKYWKKQLDIAKYEVGHCKEMIREYKKRLKNA